MSVSRIEMPAESVPVAAEVDICVVGGSCTGVFAAVRAARLGARAAVIERQGCFGGVATSGLVSIWHSLKDEVREREIIGGLTREVIDRLDKRSAVHRSDCRVNAFRLNTEELKIELDELVTEHDVVPFLDTFFSAPLLEDGVLIGVVVQTVSGRKAILAKCFVDATGDGRLARAVGCAEANVDSFQPPTMCAKIWGMHTLDDWDWQAAINDHGAEFALEPDWGWNARIPGLPGLQMHADCHVFNVDTADADSLTASQIEGRRKIRAVMDIIRNYGPPHGVIGLADIAETIGVRETIRIEARHKIVAEELLTGTRYEDAIANGSYRVDIHHADGPGISFRYLDGTEVVVPQRGAEAIVRRWREETDTNPTFYQIPLRSIVPRNIPNLMLSGRMLDADKMAFSAVRVMVNMNQTGEAAGVAAYIAIDRNAAVQSISATDVRAALEKGGSIVI